MQLDDADAPVDDADADDSIEDATGINSIPARLKRGVNNVPCNVGHILWTDRGLATWAGLQFLRSTGIHATSAMAMNRIGLPRRYMKRLLKSFRCSRGCSHGVDAASCKRWCWTVLHKGDWELQLWCDGEALVAAMTDCTSAMRTIVVGRTVAKKCVLVHVQEGIGMYSTFARSATDSGDQQRKRLQLASRRQTRQGPKGALFDAEIGFVNGSIMAKHLRGRGETHSVELCLGVLHGCDPLGDNATTADNRIESHAAAASVSASGFKDCDDTHSSVPARATQLCQRESAKPAGW